MCEIYLRFYKGELFMGNLSDQEFYHAGQTNKWTVQIPPDQHDETANYTLACFIGSNTYENKHWATPGTITFE